MAPYRRCGSCGGKAGLEDITQHEANVSVMFVPVGTQSMGASGRYFCANCNRFFTVKVGGALARLVLGLVAMSVALAMGLWLMTLKSDSVQAVLFALIGGIGSAIMLGMLGQQVWLRVKCPPVP